MSYVTGGIKSKFHIGLDGVGLLLQGAPDRLAYQMQQAPIYGNRFAQGDRSYNDFSKWWYFAQTDWLGGFKDTVSWADDAKYFFSTNIDTFSEPGVIKLLSGLVSENDFAEEIWCGSYENVAGTSFPYIGTEDGADSKPRLYRKNAGTWSDIISAYIPTSAEWIADAMAHKSKLWVISVGSAAATTFAIFKCDADGTNQVDYTAAIATAMGWTAVTGGTAIASDGNILYVAVQQSGSSKFGIVKTADGGTNWTSVVSFTTEDIIASMTLIGGKIFYLIERTGAYEFRQFTISDSIDISIQTFTATFSTVAASSSCSRRLIHSFQGKVIVVIPNDEIWAYTISSSLLTRLLKIDTYKDTTLAAIGGESSWSIGVIDVYQLKGGIFHDNKLWFGNLMYDGTYFYNTKKNFSDTANKFAIPVFSNGTSMYWLSDADLSILYVDSGYKGTADKNYILFNNYDIVSKVDKLLYSTTILFKPLVSGQKIAIEYFTGELAADSTFTALGNVNFTDDGGTIRDKTFLFPTATTFKKLWLKIKLEGDATTTPTLADVITEYLPMPNNTKLWNLNINCGDEVKRLDGGLVETTGRELKGRLERAWWTKSVLDFQDVDYATTLLNGTLTAVATTITVDSTADFPEQGRLRVDDEEITYTGKTPTTFTGCTRGIRDTRAIAHSNDAVINNAYKVILTDISARIPIALEDRELEYTIGLSLREV